MTAHNLTPRIDGTSALKIDNNSIHFTVLQTSSCNWDVQEHSLSVSIEDSSKENSFFVDDLRIALEASGLTEIIPNVRQGSIAGMPCSLSLRGIAGIVLVTLFLAVLLIV